MGSQGMICGSRSLGFQAPSNFVFANGFHSEDSLMVSKNPCGDSQCVRVAGSGMRGGQRAFICLFPFKDLFFRIFY